MPISQHPERHKHYDTIKTSLKKLPYFFKDVIPFGHDIKSEKSGNVTMIFALSAIMLTFGIGTVVDYGRVKLVKERLQDAADTAALRALLAAKKTTLNAVTEANKAFNANFKAPEGIYDITTSLVTEKIGPITEQAFFVTAKVPALFGVNINQDHFDISVESKAMSSMVKAEIALVLDVTGSMASDNRMTYLKSSVDEVLKSLVNDEGENISGTKVSITPFNKQTRTEPSENLSYVDYGTQSLTLACTGLNASLCAASWDVYDKVCLEALNKDTCRAQAKGSYKTSTASGRTYYYVTYKSFEPSGTNFKIFSYNQILYTTSGNATLNYYSHQYSPYIAASINDVSTRASNYVAITAGTLYYAINNASGYGATPYKTVASTTFGQPRLSVYPATGHTKASWLGCFDDRTQSFDVSAETATTATPESLYPARPCANSNLKSMRALTDDIATTRSYVSALQTGGNTNITIGVQWGLEALSPAIPLGGGVNFFDPETKKFMIIVTDGENTQNRWSNDTTSINARTKLACDAAKAKDITVYVVKVMDGNSDLLEACASKSEYFYDLSTASQLNDAMSDVFNSISKTRLTK